jgi:hypothetical protein
MRKLTFILLNIVAFSAGFTYSSIWITNSSFWKFSLPILLSTLIVMFVDINLINKKNNKNK